MFNLQEFLAILIRLVLGKNTQSEQQLAANLHISTERTAWIIFLNLV